MRRLFEENPFMKIVGLPWKEGEIRLEVYKVYFHNKIPCSIHAHDKKHQKSTDLLKKISIFVLAHKRLT